MRTMILNIAQTGSHAKRWTLGLPVRTRRDDDAYLLWSPDSGNGDFRRTLVTLHTDNFDEYVLHPTIELRDKHRAAREAMGQPPDHILTYAEALFVFNLDVPKLVEQFQRMWLRLSSFVTLAAQAD